MCAEQCDDVENLRCRECKYCGNGCKRIDHESVKFAFPYFACYDEGNHIICSDFEPAKWCVCIYRHWKGFEDFWPKYVEQWLPYQNTDTLVYFTLHNDSSVRYGVPLMDFVNGTMIDGNTLKAVEREYYKRFLRQPFGYKLMHDPIQGVVINPDRVRDKITAKEVVGTYGCVKVH